MTDNPLLDAVIENLEVVVDSLIKNEVLREIPVLSTVVNLLRGARDIQDRLLAAKLKRFLDDLDAVHPDTRRELFARMAANPKEAHRVGHATLAILHRIADLEKADLIAALFVAHGLGHLTSSEFCRLCGAIDHAFLDDLVEFLGVHKLPECALDGFMVALASSGITAAFGGESYEDAGKLFYRPTLLSKIGESRRCWACARRVISGEWAGLGMRLSCVL